MNKLWQVELTFRKGSGFSSLEDAPNSENAIDKAKRYARACGWTAPVAKATAYEIKHDEKETA